jgi:FixJ family two-component response regulator
METAMEGGPETPGLIIVVDDDQSVRGSLPELLRELGFTAKAFESAEELLASPDIPTAKCMILDVGLPGLSGPELQRELLRQGHAIPTIFITARSRKSIPPDLLEQGAIECVFKPFRERELREALDRVLAARLSGSERPANRE